MKYNHNFQCEYITDPEKLKKIREEFKSVPVIEANPLDLLISIEHFSSTAISIFYEKPDKELDVLFLNYDSINLEVLQQQIVDIINEDFKENDATKKYWERCNLLGREIIIVTTNVLLRLPKVSKLLKDFRTSIEYFDLENTDNLIRAANRYDYFINNDYFKKTRDEINNLLSPFRGDLSDLSALGRSFLLGCLWYSYKRHGSHKINSSTSYYI